MLIFQTVISYNLCGITTAGPYIQSFLGYMYKIFSGTLLAVHGWEEKTFSLPKCRFYFVCVFFLRFLGTNTSIKKLLYTTLNSLWFSAPCIPLWAIRVHCNCIYFHFWLYFKEVVRMTVHLKKKMMQITGKGNLHLHQRKRGKAMLKTA